MIDSSRSKHSVYYWTKIVESMMGWTVTSNLETHYFYRMMGRSSSRCSFKTYGSIFVCALFNRAVSTKQLYKTKFDEIMIIKVKNKLYGTRRKFSK